MVYNNYPAGYQPNYYYPQQRTNSRIWVQGEAGAKSYLVAPNTTVQLWDSESQVIYLKSADASGMPSMKILDYKIREAVQPTQQAQAINQTQVPTADYVTRDELVAFEAQIREQIASLTPVTKTRAKKEEKTDV